MRTGSFRGRSSPIGPSGEGLEGLQRGSRRAVANSGTRAAVWRRHARTKMTDSARGPQWSLGRLTVPVNAHRRACVTRPTPHRLGDRCCHAGRRRTSRRRPAASADRDSVAGRLADRRSARSRRDRSRPIARSRPRSKGQSWPPPRGCGHFSGSWDIMWVIEDHQRPSGSHNAGSMRVIGPAHYFAITRISNTPTSGSRRSTFRGSTAPRSSRRSIRDRRL